MAITHKLGRPVGLPRFARFWHISIMLDGFKTGHSQWRICAERPKIRRELKTQTKSANTTCTRRRGVKTNPLLRSLQRASSPRR
jgi:hypothetical protein